MNAALICLLLSVSPSLEQARKHFEEGKIDDVFLALENQKLPPAEVIPAADLLARASRSALEANDNVMAVSLSDLALKLSARHPGALEAASHAARGVEQFEQAEAFAERWIKVQPKSAEARLCRAELALEAADWQVAIDRLAPVKATGPLADKVKSVRDRAHAELLDRKSAVTPLANLDLTLIAATAAAAEARKQGFQEQAQGGGRSSDVIVYSTSWCGYCRKLKAWLKQKKIAYTEKDIEKDAGAAAELAAKAAAAGLKPTGVPVIDARGTLVVGFDPAQLEKLL